jgi:hypothetical protein
VGVSSAHNRRLLERLGCEVSCGFDGFAAAAQWACAWPGTTLPSLVVWGAPHWHASDGGVSPLASDEKSSNDDFNLVVFRSLEQQFPAALVVVPFPNYYRGARSSRCCRELRLGGNVVYAPLSSDTRWHWRLHCSGGPPPLLCLCSSEDARPLYLVDELQRCLGSGESALFLGEYDFALSCGCAVALGAAQPGGVEELDS